MKPAHKSIKYIALALGVFLAVSIISGIISAGLGLFNFLGFFSKEPEKISFSESYEDVAELDISSYAGEIKIISGDKFTVEGANLSEDFSSRFKDGKLVINNKQSAFTNLFRPDRNSKSLITISLPRGLEFEYVSIENGAGTIHVESLKTDNFYLETGAGKASIDLLVANKAEIEVGVGDAAIDSSVLGELDLEVGVGKFYMSGELNGRADISGGIGEIKLDLENEPDDHSFDVSTGIGNIKINGEKVSEGKIMAKNPKGEIEISGGIGEIIVNYKKN